MIELKKVKASNGRMMYFKDGKIISKEKYLQLKDRSNKNAKKEKKLHTSITEKKNTKIIPAMKTNRKCMLKNDTANIGSNERRMLTIAEVAEKKARENVVMEVATPTVTASGIRATGEAAVLASGSTAIERVAKAARNEALEKASRVDATRRKLELARKEVRRIRKETHDKGCRTPL